MRHFEYKSKNDHIEIKIDVYSPHEMVQTVKSKIAQWGKSPTKKLVSFKIRRK